MVRGIDPGGARARGRDLFQGDVERGARILDGAGGALTPEAGAALLERELVR